MVNLDRLDLDGPCRLMRRIAIMITPATSPTTPPVKEAGNPQFDRGKGRSGGVDELEVEPRSARPGTSSAVRQISFFSLTTNPGHR